MGQNNMVDRYFSDSENAVMTLGSDGTVKLIDTVEFSDPIAEPPPPEDVLFAEHIEPDIKFLEEIFGPIGPIKGQDLYFLLAKAKGTGVAGSSNSAAELNIALAQRQAMQNLRAILEQNLCIFLGVGKWEGLAEEISCRFREDHQPLLEIEENKALKLIDEISSKVHIALEISVDPQIN